jgi:acetyl-CoA carboxylase biotin carboxyl carrier protein
MFACKKIASDGESSFNRPPCLTPNGLFTGQLQQRGTLDLKQIKQIIDLMKRSELTEFAVEEEGFKLKIRRGPQDLPVVSNTRIAGPGYSPEPAQATSPAHHPVPHHTTSAAPASAAEEPGVIYVKSPMVGTFYRAPTPESKPFADNGTVISETSVVCIIEAMKIMNEIQAEAKGTILEILVESGQPVEYGQRLFKIKQG